MHDDGLFVRIVVEHDDLEQPTGPIGADEQGHAPVAGNGAKRVGDGVASIDLWDSVFPSALAHLHNDKLHCRAFGRQGTLSPRVRSWPKLVETALVALSQTTRVELARVAVVLGCLVVGLALWAALVVGKIGHEPIPAAFWLSAILTVVVVGVLTDTAPQRSPLRLSPDRWSRRCGPLRVVTTTGSGS